MKTTKIGVDGHTGLEIEFRKRAVVTFSARPWRSLGVWTKSSFLLVAPLGASWWSNASRRLCDRHRGEQNSSPVAERDPRPE